MLAAVICDIALFVYSIQNEVVLLTIASILLIPVMIFLLVGLFRVNPNEARVLQLFGRSVGTVSDYGLRWANPLYSKKAISLRVRNFETGQSKVNDAEGNQIEIAAVVVRKVVDTAKATIEVDDFVNFVHVQSESAVRNLATRFSYDIRWNEQISLHGDTEEIANQLKAEIQRRLHKAGL